MERTSTRRPIRKTQAADPALTHARRGSDKSPATKKAATARKSAPRAKLESNGFARSAPRHRRKFSDDDVRKLIQNGGMSISDFSRRFKVTTPAVYARIKKLQGQADQNEEQLHASHSSNGSRTTAPTLRQKKSKKPTPPPDLSHIRNRRDGKHTRTELPPPRIDEDAIIDLYARESLKRITDLKERAIELDRGMFDAGKSLQSIGAEATKRELLRLLLLICQEERDLSRRYVGKKELSAAEEWKYEADEILKMVRRLASGRQERVALAQPATHV